MICVYASDCTDFSTNGLGPVSPQSATVTETLNGEYELTLDEAGKWHWLAEGRILCAPVPAAMTLQHAERSRQGHRRGHRTPPASGSAVPHLPRRAGAGQDYRVRPACVL